MDSAFYDQPSHIGPPPKKILLVGPPRTGSTTLCNMMFAAGMGIPYEYFNEIFFPAFAERFGVPVTDRSVDLPAKFWERYLEVLLTRRSQSNLFATKIQYKQYHLFLKDSIGDALLEDAFVIYLTRKDQLAQAVSWHFAEITGQWDHDQIITTGPNPEKNFFDTQAIDYYIGEIDAEQGLWEQVFARKNIVPLRVSSEELSREPVKILQAIAERIGMPPAQFRPCAPHQARYSTDPEYPSKRAIMDFWLQGKNIDIHLLRFRGGQEPPAPIYRSSPAD
jgi:LPS sulfotransferase NodH